MSFKRFCGCNFNSKTDTTGEAEHENNFTKRDFKTESIIKGGLYGNIKLVRSISNNKLYALKIVHKSKVKKDDIVNVLFEPNLHKRLNNNPHIIHYYGLFSDSYGIYYVLEYAPNASLTDKMWNREKGVMEPLPNEEAARYAKHVSCALDYIHSVGILHGDIKPENILLDSNNNAKVADFGLAWPLIVDTKLRGKKGTPEYMAPELFTGEKYDHTIDNWALGVLCYEMLVGKSPFIDGENTVKKICSVDFDYPQIVNWQAITLISQLLLRDIKSRLPLHRVLIHPWVLMEGAKLWIIFPAEGDLGSVRPELFLNLYRWLTKRKLLLAYKEEAVV